jgi:hypothetical protein
LQNNSWVLVRNNRHEETWTWSIFIPTQLVSIHPAKHQVWTPEGQCGSDALLMSHSPQLSLVCLLGRCLPLPPQKNLHHKTCLYRTQSCLSGKNPNILGHLLVTTSFNLL